MDRRTLLRSIIVAAAGLVAAPVRSFAAEDLIMRFQQRYQGITSVRCAFSSSANLNGTLAAIRGGKFRMTMSDRVIVSDGTSVYNATPSTKTVIVNRFNPKASDVSIERVFFELLTVYTATIQSATGATRSLRLIPPAPSAVVHGVRELTVILRADTLAISSITAITDAGRFTFSITNLKINVGIPGSTFSYVPPAGWEVIDLR